ncbi:MAG: isochorismate synthase [Cytophagales bacterium]|nr:MAG: isochorismate synthase [Cytophagales bacterium]TAF61128.1 MAG: isochorismate synthase [Cytophagales bacterium]
MKFSELSKPSSYTLSCALDQFVMAALHLQMAVVCWQSPQKAGIHALACMPERVGSNSDLSQKDGFLLSPFATPQSAEWYPADFMYEEQGLGSWSFDDLVVDEATRTRFEEAINQKSIGNWHGLNAKNHNYYASREEYEDLVAKSVIEIEKHTFLKCVTSRAALHPLPVGFNTIEAFKKLAAAYPKAFVCLVSSPKHGTWLCATPETLISTDEKGIFRTMALAGTQAKNNFQHEKDVPWKQKEIEEQALVSRYIINCFKKIRLREFEEIGPRTRFAGNLAHLCSEFVVDMNKTNFQELPRVMLELLHPTSAVCGMPKEAALGFLNQHEKHDRRLYSGYLGAVTEHSTHLFVMLRCVQLLEHGLIFYAGGGIVADSDPTKEWEETLHKMNTLLSVLDKF